MLNKGAVLSSKHTYRWLLPVVLISGLFVCTVFVGCSCSSEETTTQEEESASESTSSTTETSSNADTVEGDDAQQDTQSTSEVIDEEENEDNATVEGEETAQVSEISEEEIATSPSSPVYYEKCDEYIADHGEGARNDTDNYASLTGLCFAQLFDFDDDGVNELIVAYSSDDATAFAGEGQGQSPHYVVEVWKYKDGSAERVYQEAALVTGEGSEAVAWGMSQYGGYVVSGQSGLGATQYYYSIGDQGSTQFAEVTWTDDDELMVNGSQADDNWLDESVFNEYLLAGNGMSQECERTLAAFNETVAALKQSTE